MTLVEISLYCILNKMLMVIYSMTSPEATHFACFRMVYNGQGHVFLLENKLQ